MGEVERTVETDELRADQATIRAELYGGMMDAYAGGDAANVGRRVVLGPNFTRSARQFGRSYQDALALLREHGPGADVQADQGQFPYQDQDGLVVVLWRKDAGVPALRYIALEPAAIDTSLIRDWLA